MANERGFNDQQKKELVEIIQLTVPPIVEKIVEEKTAPYFEAIQHDLTELKEGQVELRGDVKEIRGDMSEMKEDLDAIRRRQEAQQTMLDTHDQDITALKKHLVH